MSQISFHDCGTTDLTPERLAAFYHKVGGNYDTLFLETKPPALSFIYQSLGCFHSLQPSTNAFEPPSLPALLPSGFVRWQTIQILLDPDEHVRYLQNAVGMWDIRNPFGGFFPKFLPRDAFPPGPDLEMVQWHEQVSRRLEYDYLKRSVPRSSPPSFEPYQHRFLPKQSALVPVRNEEPEEEKALVRTRHRTVPQYRYVEANDTPPRVQNGRRSSAEHPPSSSHRPHPTFSPPPEVKPRAPSPPVWPERPVKSRGRERASSIGNPVGPEGMPGYYPSDASSEDPRTPTPEPSPRYSRRHSSPHRGSRARRHSHDAYARKAFRDTSPDYPRHYAPRPHHPGGLHDVNVPPRGQWVYKDDIPHPKHSGVKFREYAFEEPATVPSSPETPVYFPVHTRYANPGYMAPPHAPDPNVEEARRRSYSGGSLSERPRPFAVPGAGPWPAQTPMHVYPAHWPPKKFIPVAVPDAEYATPGRRVYR